MSIDLILLVVVVGGFIALLGLKGATARRLRWVFLFGIVTALGGCVGMLGWLGAETSGSSNIFHAASPIIWLGLLALGAVVLLAAAIAALALRGVDRSKADG